jgi:hypothetical protein
MNVKRTAMIVLGAGALAAWFAGAATSNREMPDPVSVRTPPIDTHGAALADEIAKLQERLRPSAEPNHPGRNLFAFRAAHVPVVPVALPAPQPALTEAPAATPAPPPFKLAGIAEDPGANGPVRTAILSGGGQVYLVKEGENVTSRYRVTRIAADVVELTDVTDGTTRRLALK